MKADRLRNLLQEMDNRLLRAEKSIVEIDGKSGPANNVVQKLSAVRAEVRRFLSKIDSIRIGDVESLERHVAHLRDAAGDRLQAFGHEAPISQPLRSIFQDGIGLLNISAGLKIGLNQLGPDDLLDLVPGQKTAAFQFGFDDGDLLVVVDQPFRPNQRENDMALAALETVIDHGDYVSSELANTNVSPRLKDAFSKLQDTLLSHKNIVQVGARTQICNRLVNADAEELSSSLFNLLIGHVEMVFSALAQFEQWRIYSENAVATDLDKGSVAQLEESARALVDHLRRERSADVAVSEHLKPSLVGWAIKISQTNATCFRLRERWRTSGQ